MTRFLSKQDQWRFRVQRTVHSNRGLSLMMVLMVCCGLLLVNRSCFGQQTPFDQAFRAKTVEAVVDSLFKRFDKDNDGFLTSIELRQIRGIPGWPAGFGDDKKLSRQELILALTDSSQWANQNRIRPIIGFSMRDSDDGVEVLAVVPRSGAAIAGIRRGDVVLQIDDTAIQTIQQLRDEMKGVRAGDKVELQLRRQNATKSVTVTVQNFREPESPNRYPSTSNSEYLRNALLSLTPDKNKSSQTQSAESKRKLNQPVTIHTLSDMNMIVISGVKDDVETVSKAIRALIVGFDQNGAYRPPVLPGAPGIPPTPKLRPRPIPPTGEVRSIPTHVWIVKANGGLDASRFEGKTSAEVDEAVSGLSRAPGFQYDRFQFSAIPGESTRIESGASIPVAESATKMPGGGNAYQFSNRDVGVKLQVKPKISGSQIIYNVALDKSEIEDSNQSLGELGRAPMMAKQTLQLSLETSIACNNGRSTCVSVKQSGRSWLVIVAADMASSRKPKPSSTEATAKAQQEAARKAIIELMRERTNSPSRAQGSGGNRSGNSGGNRSGNTGGNRSGNDGGSRSGNTGGNRSGNSGGNRSGNSGGNRSGKPDSPPGRK